MKHLFLIYSIVLLVTVFFNLSEPKEYVPEFDYIKETEIFCYYEYYTLEKERLKNSEFSKKALIEYLNLRNVRNKEIVFAQSRLETGNFSSSIFQESNNLFGMKFPLIRETTATFVNKSHAGYDHWTDSVDDYVLWYQYFTRGSSYDNYYSFLEEKNYAEDPEYINKLQNLINYDTT